MGTTLRSRPPTSAPPLMTTPSTPTISVIMAAYNAAAFISEAIESALEQTRPAHEIVVVDDGSTDATADVVRGFPQVRYLHQQNQGASAARNRAIEASTGSYLAVLDADDLWPAQRLEAMADHLDAHPEVGIVFGQQEVLLEGDGPWPAWLAPATDPASGVIDPSLLPVAANSFVARRSAFDTVGLYATDMRHGEDTDWFLRAREAGIGHEILPDVVLVRRVHGSNLTVETDGQRTAMFDVLHRRIERRRAAATRETPP